MAEKQAPLEKVCVSDNVVQACLAHALMTEQEEVMGLLLGEITVRHVASPEDSTTAANTAGANATAAAAGVKPAVYKSANVWDSWVVQRSVGRSDRVEIAPEMLSGASEEAERCTKRVGRHTRVIGWYHSHPRITPYPSQVDLGSQSTYQLLESGWVGLIFSVFYHDASNRNCISIHCFQTGTGETHEIVKLEVVPVAQMPLKASPSCEAIYRLLQVFSAEVSAAVELVRQRSKNAPDAMAAALALQDVQLYTLEKLITQPALQHLHSSILVLERKTLLVCIRRGGGGAGETAFSTYLLQMSSGTFSGHWLYDCGTVDTAGTAFTSTGAGTEAKCDNMSGSSSSSSSSSNSNRSSSDHSEPPKVLRLGTLSAAALSLGGSSPAPLYSSIPCRSRSGSSCDAAGSRRMWSLDDFDVGRKLGEGRFGKIYLAREKQTKCAVVLKCLSKDMIRYHNLAHQLQREVELQEYAGRYHRHVLRLFAYFWDDVRVFLVLEYADGGSLQNLLDSRPQDRLSEKEACDIVRQLLSALMFLHERDIIHRDVKPDNILFKKQEVRLADFSWAVRLDRSDARRSRRYTLCGTLDYLSPEQVSKRGCNTKADMWSLGVLTYRMLCGHLPFGRCSAWEVCSSIAKGDVQFPSHLSLEAQHFIAALLSVNELTRFTCHEAMQHPFIQGHRRSSCDADVGGVKTLPVDVLVTPEHLDMRHMTFSLPTQIAIANTQRSLPLTPPPPPPPPPPSPPPLLQYQLKRETRKTTVTAKSKEQPERGVGRAASRRPSVCTENHPGTPLSGMSFVTVSSSRSTECIPSQPSMSTPSISFATHADWLLSDGSCCCAVAVSSPSAAAAAAAVVAGTTSKISADDVGMSSCGASNSRPRTHCSVSDGSYTATTHHRMNIRPSPTSSIAVISRGSAATATAAIIASAQSYSNDQNDVYTSDACNNAGASHEEEEEEEEGANCVLRLRFDDDDDDWLDSLSQLTAVSASTIHLGDNARSSSTTPLLSAEL